MRPLQPKEKLELARPLKQKLAVKEPRILRFFNLAFQHFDEELALKTLQGTFPDYM